jgi:hypothetical protein
MLLIYFLVLTVVISSFECNWHPQHVSGSPSTRSTRRFGPFAALCDTRNSAPFATISMCCKTSFQRACALLPASLLSHSVLHRFFSVCSSVGVLLFRGFVSPRVFTLFISRSPLCRPPLLHLTVYVLIIARLLSSGISLTHTHTHTHTHAQTDAVAAALGLPGLCRALRARTLRLGGDDDARSQSRQPPRAGYCRGDRNDVMSSGGGASLCRPWIEDEEQIAMRSGGRGLDFGRMYIQKPAC